MSSKYQVLDKRHQALVKPLTELVVRVCDGSDLMTHVYMWGDDELHGPPMVVVSREDLSGMLTIVICFLFQSIWRVYVITR